VRIDGAGDPNEFVLNPVGQRASYWDPVAGYEVQGQAYWGAAPVEYYQAGYAHFQHQNWMGTERARTTYTSAVESLFQSLPFGDNMTNTGTDSDAYHFGMLDHDYATDTEHAMLRQYNSAQGHWMRPDPYMGSYNFSNPQSFNRYAYVLNNPLSNIDPSGLNHCSFWSGCGGTGGDCLANPNCSTGDFGGAGGGGDGGGCAPSDSTCGGEEGGLAYSPSGAELAYQNWMDDIVNGADSSLDPGASETIYVGCTGANVDDLTCMPYFLSAQYFAAGTTPYYSNPIRALANGVNTASGGFGSLQSIGEFYGASLIAASGAFAAADAAAGADGSLLFGRGYYGWTGYLNGNSAWGSAFRVGFGWDGAQQVFRISGSLIEEILDSGHIDLWPPSAW
jgi:RHS repeat-associated protein